MATKEIPCSSVIENGDQSDAVVVGGSTALQVNDGDVGYAEGLYREGTSDTGGLFRVAFPPTPLSGPVTSAELVMVGRYLTGRTVDYSLSFTYNVSQLLVSGFGSTYTEVTEPLPDLTRAMVQAGSAEWDGFDVQASFYDLRVTYMALRVTYTPGVQRRRQAPPLRLYPRDDGLGPLGGAPRLSGSKSQQRSGRILGGYL